MEMRDRREENSPLNHRQSNGSGPWTRSQPSAVLNGLTYDNRPSLPTTPVPRTNSVTFLERISQLPELREMPWRRNQSLPPEKSTDSPRVQQRGACMVATRGRIMGDPCTHCAQGFGRFSSCIVLDNWFQGACATCIFTSKGNKCSLRILNLGDQDARALRYANDPDRKRKRSSIKAEDDRRTFINYAACTPYVSPYPALPRPPIRVQREEKSEELDMDTLLQEQIAREAAHEGSVDRENGNTRQNAQAAASMANFRPPLYLPDRPRPRPPAALMQTTTNSNTTTRESIPAPNSHVTEEPLIDTYPKTQQRQIFALVSGLHGGMKNIQKELNNLKGLIGLEDDEQCKTP